jgi:hypothetical protein
MRKRRLKQTNLDLVITREPKQPPFTVPGLLDYIIEMIILADEVGGFQM